MTNNSNGLPTCEIKDNMAILRLNNPDQVNPIDEHVAAKLCREIRELQTVKEVGVIVITGNGKAFSGGGDISSFKLGLLDQEAYANHVVNVILRETATPLLLAIRSSSKPVICAVNGAAAGIGAGLALACDFVIADNTAFFTIPFMPNLGIIPDMGMTWLLPRLIGRPRAIKMALLGEKISADQALEWGMISDCVEASKLMTETQKLAHKLSQLPTHAITEIRTALDLAINSELVTHLEYEAVRQGELLRKPEFREGVEAFLEKRKPNFHNLSKT